MQHQKITTLLLVILIIDTICTLPLCGQAVAIIYAPNRTVFCPTNITHKVFDIIVEIFIHLKPTYNFWLYSFQHKEFKQEAIKMFQCAQRSAIYDCFCRLCCCSSNSYYNVRPAAPPTPATPVNQ